MFLKLFRVDGELIMLLLCFAFAAMFEFLTATAGARFISTYLDVLPDECWHVCQFLTKMQPGAIAGKDRLKPVINLETRCKLGSVHNHFTFIFLSFFQNSRKVLIVHLPASFNNRV